MRKLFFSNGSPFARKVRIVLHEKGLDYERDVQDRVRPVEEIASLNPALAVPVLVDRGLTLSDGDLTLFDSDLILAYLFETYPENAPDAPRDPPLAPWMARPERRWEDARTLAAIRAFADSAVNLRLMGRDGVTPETSAYMARQAARVQRCLDWLEARAAPEGFAPGWFSAMDIAFICPVAFGERRGVLEWRGRPRLEALFDRLQARPSVAATPVDGVPPKEG